ncbi:hypothetical protein NDU88_000625, partial [Pleurodeles waltl]
VSMSVTPLTASGSSVDSTMSSIGVDGVWVGGPPLVFLASFSLLATLSLAEERKSYH